MWENETIVLVSSLKKRILGDKERIRLGKITADDAIPAFVKNLFKKQVEFFIQEETPITVQSTSHFLIQPDDLDKLTNRFLDVFREAAMFTTSEVEDVLHKALVLRLDYLVKPVDTMRRILFEDNSSVDTSIVEEKFKSITKVLPYTERMLKECQAQGKTALDNDSYGKMVTDMFHQLMNNDPVKHVLKDFSVLTDFLSEAKGEEVFSVEGIVLQDFLADRNLWGFRRALDVELKLGKKDFNSKELEMTLKRFLELKDELMKEEVSEDVKTEELKIEEPVPEVAPIDFDIDFDDKKEPEEPKVQEQKIEEDVFEDLKDKGWDLEEALKKDTFEEPKPKKKTASKEKAKQMKIIRKEEKKESDPPPQKSEDKEPVVESAITGKSKQENNRLNNYIDGKTEKGFIKKLFGGNKEAYEDLINKLDQAESWRVAKILIDNELFKRDVDPFSREAIKLVDLVYSLFYPEEGAGGKK